MKRLVCATAVALLCLALPASAEGERVFERDGVIVRYANWLPVQADGQVGLERVLELEPTDLEQSTVYRACYLERANLPTNPGMTQEILNARLVTEGPRQYQSSPTYSEFDRTERITTVEVDGIAVLDVIVRGDGRSNPSWMHDRIFAIVRNDGGGLYYRFSCAAMNEPSSAHIAEMDEVLASLRFESTQ